MSPGCPRILDAWGMGLGAQAGIPALLKGNAVGLKTLNGSDVSGENRAGAQLHHAISGGTEDSEIHCAASAHAHHDDVDLSVPCELNDLLVWFAKAYGRLNFDGFAPFLRQNFLELGCGVGDGLLGVLRTWILFQYVKQSEFGVVL